MGRRARRAAPSPEARLGWGERLLLALGALSATLLGVVWAGGGWRTGLLAGAGAAVLVLGAIALAATMPARPSERDE